MNLTEDDFYGRCLYRIKFEQNFKDTAYRRVPNDPKLTIGFGHRGDDVTEGMKITKDQATTILFNDFNKTVSDV